MNKEQIFDKAVEIYDDYTIFNNLVLTRDLISLLTDEIGLNLENKKDVRMYNTLVTCLLNLNEIIKENE